MYLVELINDDIRTTIHHHSQSKVKLSSGTVKKELNTIDNFNFYANLANPAWQLFTPLKSIVEVLDTKQNKLIFKGRALDPAGEMNDNGSFSKTFVCEGEIAYLKDSIQRHYEFRGRLAEYFIFLLNRHNAQVPDSKKIYPGKVTVSDNNDYVYFYCSYDNTWDTMQDDLIDAYGGHLFLRYGEDGKRYLDYLAESGKQKEMPIELAKNMLSISNTFKPSSVITRLIPLGKSIESEDENATDASQARLDITLVNGGKDYLDDVALIAEFGIIEGTVIWEEVAVANTLKTKGVEWQKNQRITNTMTVDALNLSLIDERYEDFELGNYYTPKNSVLGIDDSYQCTGQSIDILSPQKSDLSFSDKHLTLTQYQKSMKKSQTEVDKLKTTIKAQTVKLSSLTSQVTEAQKTITTIQISLGDTDLKEISRQLTELSNELSDIQASINQLPTNEDIVSLQNQINALNTVVATNYQNAELKFASIEQRLSALEGV